MNVVKKVVLAFAITAFLTFLGVFEGLGYHIYSLKEISFTPYTRLGYADATFYCDVIFNPFLHPYCWLRGYGRLNSNISIFYLSEHPNWLYDTASGMPNMETDSDWYPWGWGRTPRERCETYKSYVSLVGTPQNFVILLVISFIIEIVSKRTFYIAFFAGIVGFAVAAIIGLVIGLIGGLSFMLIMCLSSKIDDFLIQIWNYLWK